MKRMLCLLLALFPLLLTLTLLGIALLAGMRYLHAWLPVLLLSQLLDPFFVWKHRWKGLTASVLIGCLPLLLAGDLGTQMRVLGFFFAAYYAGAYVLCPQLKKR